MHNKLTREQYGKAYENGSHRTVAVLSGRGVNRDFAEEISQDAWARGWERLAQLKDARRIVEWVNSIAVNLLRTEISRSRRITELSSAAADVRISPLADLALIDLRRAVSNAPERQQVAIRRVYLCEQSVAEVATALGITEGALHHRLSRGRRSLRKAMDAA